MKPIYIKMKAFGSYVDEKIDFEDVNHGIFLITGDTGSGKTTIFDAITYALYDVSSGGKRSDKMMVSHFADPTQKTEVEYKFSVGSDVYRITRRPEQLKYKAKENEDGEIVYEALKTTDKSSVELVINDVEFIGKKKEVDEKIVEIMGIDDKQFCQIAMLAQGKFRELLEASSKERKEIFAKIFDTYIYSRIEEGITQRFKTLKDELDDNETIIKERISSVKLLDESTYQEEWSESGLFSEGGREELDELINKINQEIKAVYDDFDKQGKLLSEELSELEVKINNVNEINKAFDNLEKSILALENLEKRKAEIEALSKTLEVAKRAQNIEKIEVVYRDRVKEKENKENRVSQLTSDQKQINESLTEATKAKEEHNTKYEKYYSKYLEEKTSLESSLPQYDEVDELIKAYNRYVNKKEELCDELNNISEYEKALIVEDEELNKLHEDLLDKNKSYEQIMLDYINNQIPIIRKTLIPGEPCPVCGSIHHNVMESSFENYISIEDVEKAKTLSENAKTLFEDKKTKLEEKHNELIKKKESLSKDLSNNELLIEEKKNQIKKEQNKLIYSSKNEAAGRINELTKNINELQINKDKADRFYIDIKGKSDSVNASLITESNNLTDLNTSLQLAKDEFYNALSVNNFKDEEEYLSSKMTEEDMKDCQRELDEYKESIRELKTKIDLYKENTKGKTRVDNTELINKKGEITSKIEYMEKRGKSIYVLYNNNENALVNINKGYDDRDALRERYIVTKSLYDTSTGRLSGKHINFQTYIQRRFFARVVEAANTRLVKMSNNQFCLECRALENLKSQGEVGLDLDVYNVITDKTADVNTLSGGEGFMAALSMALGLSDVIQSAAGKVRIDTMFIDEGFGTLDTEVRNQALDLLNDLSEGNQLIGVISHVTELKDQIDTKLVITKNEMGSKAVWYK